VKTKFLGEKKLESKGKLKALSTKVKPSQETSQVNLSNSSDDSSEDLNSSC